MSFYYLFIYFFIQKSRRAGIRKTEQPFVRQNYDSPYLQPLHHKQAAVTRKKVKVKRKLRGVTGEYRDIVRPDSDESGVPVDPKVTEEFIEQVDSICESLTENKGKLPTIPTWEETFLEALISTQVINIMFYLYCTFYSFTCLDTNLYMS